MKNIYLISTDKLNGGYILGKCIKELSDVKIGQFVNTYYLMFDIKYFKPYNVYITSEEISGLENDIWVCTEGRVWKWESTMAINLNKKPKKVILTTDPDLIVDGVQAIDDAFLEWLAKNPTCEYVEVVYNPNKWLSMLDSVVKRFGEYKIFVPPQKYSKIGVVTNNYSCKCLKCGNPFFGNNGENQCGPCSEALEWSKVRAENYMRLKDGYTQRKQEYTHNTCDMIFEEEAALDSKEYLEELEKAAEDYSDIYGEKYEVKGTLAFINTYPAVQEAFEAGASWQAERVYSEEDMIAFARWSNRKEDKSKADLLKIWFEQNKK